MEISDKHQLLFNQSVQLTTALVSNIESEEVMRLISSIAGKPAGLLGFDDLFTDVYKYLDKKYNELA
jgi:hypothetical protein